MPELPSVKSSEISLISVPAFWPMAMAAALAEEGSKLYADKLKFVEEEIKMTSASLLSSVAQAETNRNNEMHATRIEYGYIQIS